jgi:hypothetical protein
LLKCLSFVFFFFPPPRFFSARSIAEHGGHNLIEPSCAWSLHYHWAAHRSNFACNYEKRC